MAHAFDNHNASLSEGDPSLLWWRPCLESLIGHGLARIPRVRCDERSGAAPGVSPPHPARRTGGKKVEGATPLFLPLVRHRGGVKGDRQNDTFTLPLKGGRSLHSDPCGKAVESARKPTRRTADHRWP